MKRALLIDALNMYYRAYIVDPTLSPNGDPVGGVAGFLKILQKLIRETKPDQIVVAWDGAGGSKRRRTINKNYKEGRKPIRLNRTVENLNEQEEYENKIWQQTRLIQYMNEMPICQIMIPSIEADDVIAHITGMPQLKNTQKVIISSDKDFIQLCDDETVLYRPVQKEVMSKKTIVEKFDIHPNNFALARAISGDKSDNLKGVGSVGLKTIAKRFPMLREEKFYTLEDVVEHCRSEDTGLKVYSNIIEKQNLVRENYKIMQLYAPSIPINSKDKIKNTLEDACNEFNKTEVIKLMMEDGIGAYDWNTLFTTFRRIISDNA
jgi:5'-3' exonuclease